MDSPIDARSRGELNARLPNSNLKNKTTLKKHILSHQQIYANFYELEIRTPLKSKLFVEIDRDELDKYATPQLINKYLQFTGNINTT